MRYNGAKYCFTLAEAMDHLCGGSWNSFEEIRRLKKIPDDFKKKWLKEYVNSAEICSWCNTIRHSPSHWTHVCKSEAAMQNEVVLNVEHFERPHDFQLLEAWGNTCDICGEPDAKEHRETTEVLCEKHAKRLTLLLRPYRQLVKEAKEAYLLETSDARDKKHSSLDNAEELKDLITIDFLAKQTAREAATKQQ